MRSGECRTILVSLCLAALACALGACSSIRPPTFRALDARAQQGEDGIARLIVRVEARNHADTPLPLERVAYTLSVGGSSAFTGDRSPEVTLPTFGTQVFELPCVLEGPAPAAGTPFHVSGRVWYREPGKVAEALRDYRVRVPEAALNVQGAVER